PCLKFPRPREVVPKPEGFGIKLAAQPAPSPLRYLISPGDSHDDARFRSNAYFYRHNGRAGSEGRDHTANRDDRVRYPDRNRSPEQRLRGHAVYGLSDF